MTLATYYGLIPSNVPALPQVTVVPLNTGGIAAPLTVYFHLAIRNAVGWSFTTPGVQATISGPAGARIEVIVPDNIIPNQALDVKSIALLISTTGFPPDAVVLRSFQASELPYVAFFLNQEDLTPPDNPISIYVENITTDLGYLQDLTEIDSGRVQLEAYIGDGSAGPETKFTILNGEVADLTAAIPAGTFISFKVLLNNINAASTFSGKLEYRLYGYYDFETGTINTDDLTLADTWYTWNATEPLIYLERELPAGQGLYIGVRPRFNITQMPEIGSASFIQFFPYLIAPRGQFTRLAKAFGNVMFASRGGVKILPQKGPRILQTDGHGVIYDRATPFIPRRVYNINTAIGGERIVWIDSDGLTGINNDISQIPLDAAPRALFSSQAGESRISNFSDAIGLNNNILDVTVSLSTTIRGDYPDETLAGRDFSTEDIFNPTHLNIYIEQDSTSIRRFRFALDQEEEFLTGIVNRTYEFQSLAGGAVVLEDSLPTTPFSFFETGTPALISGLGLGSLTGSFRVATSLEWDGSTVTDITHDRERGLVPDLPYTLAQTAEDSAYWLFPVDDLSTSIDPVVRDIRPNAIRFQASDDTLWRWQVGEPPFSSNPFDVTIIPDGLAGRGYWTRLLLPTSEELVRTNQRTFLSGSNLSENLDIIEDKLATIAPNLQVDTAIALRQISGLTLVPYQLANIWRYNHWIAFFDPVALAPDNGVDIIRPFDIATSQPGRWRVKKAVSRVWTTMLM